jgi:hypothetical protein
VLLTKVTPGVGLLWLALRREWGALAVALGATVAIAALSWAAAPALWKQWIGVLLMLVGVVPLARSRHVPQVRRSAGGDEANPEAPAHDPNHHP